MRKNTTGDIIFHYRFYRIGAPILDKFLQIRALAPAE